MYNSVIMKESKRQKQFARQLQQDLGTIFQQNARKMFEGDPFITVTHVTVSPDLSVAKIHLSFLMVNDKQEMIERINMRKSEIRGVLGRKIGKFVRVVPELIFYLDESAEHASRIDQILSDLDIPPEED